MEIMGIGLGRARNDIDLATGNRGGKKLVEWKKIPVPAEQLVVEEQAHLRDHVVPSDDETPEKVVGSIVLELRHGSLRASQNDGLTQVAHHKAQRRARISQTIGAMQNHKSIEQPVIPLDSTSDLSPSLGIDAGAVEQRRELEGGETEATGMLGRWSTQGLKHLGVAVADHNGDVLEGRSIIEAGLRPETRVQEPGGLRPAAASELVNFIRPFNQSTTPRGHTGT